MATSRQTTTNTATNALAATATQQIRQRKRQLTTITLIIKLTTLLTVLIQTPANSIAASLNSPIPTSSPPSTSAAATVLPPASADNMLSNSHTAVLKQLADTMSSGQGVRRKRLRKRHSAKIRVSELAAMSDEQMAIEWLNACGGQQIGPLNIQPANDADIRKELLLLKRSLRNEYTRFTSLQKIAIKDLARWRSHKKIYRFLPLLNRNADIKLRHWHHAMQKFVASFVIFGVQQYRWEHTEKNRQRGVDLSHELNLLLLSAKRVLCDVEMAFNVTNPQDKLKRLTHDEVHSIRKFAARNAERLNDQGVLLRDLKFTKQRFFRYMHSMSHILRQHLKTNRAATRAASKSVMSSNESNSKQWLELSQLLEEASVGETSASETLAQAAAAGAATSNEYLLGA